jgi:hypothetical protein
VDIHFKEMLSLWNNKTVLALNNIESMKNKYRFEMKHHRKDTFLDSDKLKHQLTNESRNRYIAGKILFDLMCLLAAAVVCFAIWIYWFND